MKNLRLIEQAKLILENNYKDGYTIPRKNLYPFQWNWDSGFISIGYSNYDLNKAEKELESLFLGQWKNGMLPHIVFHSEKETTYFPNHDFWQSHVNKGAPTSPKTSGITQPPVHGFALHKIFTKNASKVYVKNMFEKVKKFHRFLYNYRDPHKEGLVFIYHPWESGRDNSPLWDAPLDNIDLEKVSIPNYVRKDLDHVDDSQRPTNDKYDKYVYLLELGKANKYENKGIFEDSPFLVQDAMFNALLIKSNQCLIEIGGYLNIDTKEIEEWQDQSIKTYNEKLWNSELNFYTSFDLRSNKQIKLREVGSLSALFANIPDLNKAKTLSSYLWDIHKKGFYLSPSFDPEHEQFDSKRYWRGPIWPQMNWLVYQGLKEYGYTEIADVVRNDLINMVDQFGFSEYFESNIIQTINGNGAYGGDSFSWTASTIIDFLSEEVAV